MSNTNARLQVREDSAENAWKDVGNKSSNEYLPVIIKTDEAGIGGGTQYAEDSQHNSGDTGTMMLGVRNDTLASLGDTDGDYVPPQFDADGALYVIEKNLVDSNNSSTSTLGSSASFTGTSTEVVQYSAITVTVDSDQDSAADGLKMQFSSDGTNWDIERAVTYDASDGGASYVISVLAQYFRVVYTNGGTGQSHFRLETILHANNVSPIDGRLSDEVSPERFGALTKSAIVAQGGGTGNFVPVQSTNGGSLKISLEEAEGLKGQNTMAESVPVVIASNQSDISIDDGGNSITVDGTVTASLGATDNAVLDAIDSNTDYGAITGGGTEAGALRVTIANNSTGVLSIDDNGTTISIDDGGGNISIDDGGNIITVDGTVTASNTAGDVAHDGADSGNPIKFGGRAQEPTTALDEVADNDRVDAAFDRQGRLAVWNGYDVKNAAINTSTSGDNTIVSAAGAGIRIAVLGFSIVSDGTVDCRWEDGAGGTAFTGQYPFQAREGIVRNGGLQPLWVGSANTLLNLELSAAVNVHGEVSYIEMTD